MVFHKSRAEGQNHLLLPAGYASFDAAQHQDTIDFLGCKPALPAHVQYFIYQCPPIFLDRLLSILLSSRLYWFQGLLQPRCRTFQSALLNFLSFARTWLSSLWRSLWMATLPSSSVGCTTVWCHRQTCWECTQSLSTGPSTDLRGTPPITALH